MYLVEPRKVTEYLLSEDHPVGGGKSRLFQQHGFRVADWPDLLAALQRHPMTAVLTDQDDSSICGKKVTFECRIASPDGRNPCIRTVWQASGQGWRLITAYPFL